LPRKAAQRLSSDEEWSAGRAPEEGWAMAKREVRVEGAVRWNSFHLNLSSGDMICSHRSEKDCSFASALSLAQVRRAVRRRLREWLLGWWW
jgi:hypothetical protein